MYLTHFRMNHFIKVMVINDIHLQLYKVFILFCWNVKNKTKCIYLYA